MENNDLTPEPKLTREQYRKLTRPFKIVILILGIFLLGNLYVFYLLGRMKHNISARPGFRDPMPHATASEAADNYRSIPTFPIGTKRSKGVVYSPDDITGYLKDHFYAIKDDMVGKPGCEWVVGFYYMKKFDANGERKMDFLVIPTLREITPDGTGLVYDYFDPANSALYHHSKPNPKFSDPADGDAYDAGELWP